MTTAKPSRPTFAERIRTLRKEADFTQRDLAEKVKIDFTYLSKLENGRGDPPAEDTIRRMAEALGSDANELLALAGKISAEVRERAAEDQEFAMLLRKLPELPDDVLRKMYRDAGVNGNGPQDDVRPRRKA